MAALNSRFRTVKVGGELSFEEFWLEFEIKGDYYKRWMARKFDKIMEKKENDK